MSEIYKSFKASVEQIRDGFLKSNRACDKEAYFVNMILELGRLAERVDYSSILTTDEKADLRFYL